MGKVVEVDVFEHEVVHWGLVCYVDSCRWG